MDCCFFFEGKTAQHNSLYKCICDCGTISIVKDSNLKHNKSTQCKSCSGKQNGRKGIDAQVKSHLYFIKCGEYFKIGTTDNIKERLRTMIVSNPYPLEVIYYAENKGYLETWWHSIFKTHHHQGEWFKLSL